MFVRASIAGCYLIVLANLVNASQPLTHLTKLIKTNRLAEARKLSRVLTLPNADGVESYSGFLTIEDWLHDYQIFYWYFPAMKNPSTAPVILWLSGGPGWSGLNALFDENGPFKVDSQGVMHKRNETWTKEFSVVFVDQPVGTGFSYSLDFGDFEHTMKSVVKDLLYFTRQFLKLYELENRDFYISGQSFGGKFAVQLATVILEDNKAKSPVNSTTYINLKGISIGNGYIDNIFLTDSAEYLYQHGLLTIGQKAIFQKEQSLLKQYLQNKQYVKASRSINILYNGFGMKTSLIENYTGFTDLTNSMYSSGRDEEETYFVKFINQPEVRNAIHVGKRSFVRYSLLVVLNLILETPVSVMGQLLKLVDNKDLKILVYNGELDLICPYPLTQQLFHGNMKGFADTERKIWRLNPSDKEIAGYITHPTRNLWLVMIRGAGHSAPEDQPLRCLDIITKFIKNVDL